MNVLLLTSPWRQEALAAPFMKRGGGGLGRLLGRPEQTILGLFPPLGILYVAAALEQAGHRVEVLDGHFADLPGILERARRGRHQVVGISSYTAGWEADKRTLTALREGCPGVILVVGGPHPSAWKERCLIECAALDAVVCGEGEHIMTGLVGALADGASLAHVEGVVWRDAGRIRTNPARPFVSDLDALPLPARSLVDLRRYIPTLTCYRRLPSTPVIASRGCPYECIFCHSVRNVRFRDPEHVLAELEVLVGQYGIRDVTFYDETFTLNRPRAMQLCAGMLRRGLDLTWAANARPERLDAELLLEMRRAGCWRLLFGIESGSQRVLDAMKKGTTIAGIERAIGLARASGIETHGTFIFGTPGETYADGLETIRFAKELGLDYAAFGGMAPLPGTELYESVGAGVRDALEEQTLFTSSYVPPSMTADELDDLMTRGYREFYLRPSYVLRRFARLRSVEDVRRHALGLRGLLSLR